MERFGWDFPPVGVVFGKIVPVVVRLLFINGLIEVFAVLANFQPGLIDGDLDQPGAEFGFATESGQGGEGLQNSFLRHFLSIGGVIENRHGSGKDAAFTWLNEAKEGLGVALANTP